MPDVDTITLSRVQYEYLWDQLPKWGVSGVLGTRYMTQQLGLPNPSEATFELSYCPDTPKMGLGQKLLWLVAGALGVYVGVKIVTK